MKADLRLAWGERRPCLLPYGSGCHTPAVPSPPDALRIVAAEIPLGSMGLCPKQERTTREEEEDLISPKEENSRESNRPSSLPGCAGTGLRPALKPSSLDAGITQHLVWERLCQH